MLSLTLSSLLTLVSISTYVQAVSVQSPRYAQSNVVDCLKAHKVPFVIKTSSNWTDYATPFNLRLVYQPAVITIPNTAADVSASVTCAAAAHLKVQPKSGGHSYASFSSGGQDGSLIVDMEKFSEITVDKKTQIAKVGAGQRLGNIAVQLYNQGKRALPHGTCAGVGIGGHALHGGYGYDSRKWGLTLDHIVALDVVLANGTQVHTTDDCYPEIFYAMRGAGESFGIVTTFYLKTEAAPKSVVWFTANLGASLQDLDKVVAAFEKLQKFTLTSPLMTEDITYGFFIDSSGSMSLRGWCMECDPTKFNTEVFQVMLSGFSHKDVVVESQGWIPALENLAAPDPLPQLLGSGYKLHDTFYAKSLVVKNEKPLTTASIRSYWAYVIANQGKGPWFSILNLYGAASSKINVPSADSSAYSDRDALWVFQNYGYSTNHQAPFDPAIIPIVDGLNAAVEKAQPDGDFGGYLNYVDPSLNPTMAAEEYYGAKTYDKLLGLKAKYDPGFVFWNPQAIGNAMALPL